MVEIIYTEKLPQQLLGIESCCGSFSLLATEFIPVAEKGDRCYTSL
jgi:hypothetical protein